MGPKSCKTLFLNTKAFSWRKSEMTHGSNKHAIFIHCYLVVLAIHNGAKIGIFQSA